MSAYRPITRNVQLHRFNQFHMKTGWDTLSRICLNYYNVGHELIKLNTPLFNYPTYIASPSYDICAHIDIMHDKDMCSI